MDCLFYFPDTNIDKNHGTIIYEKTNDEIKVGNRVEYEGFDAKNFKIAKKFDYIPNTVVAWINNEKAFMEQIQTGNQQKKIKKIFSLV